LLSRPGLDLEEVRPRDSIRHPVNANALVDDRASVGIDVDQRVAESVHGAKVIDGATSISSRIR
jgi:hypothetical protein